MPSVEELEPSIAKAHVAPSQASQELTPPQESIQIPAPGNPVTAVSPVGAKYSFPGSSPHHEPGCPLSEDAGIDDPSDDEAQAANEAEAQDASEAAADVPSPVVGTLEEADQLFEQGRQALGSSTYDEAAELFSRALEIRAHHHGELAFECAFTYYKYGCALLDKAQSETDALGGVRETDNDEKVEDEEDIEEESDLDMAWKMLDIARVIYEKQDSHSIEEVDTITALADVSLEREDFEMCLRDYTRALEILEGLVEPDDRGIAQLCFKISLALQFGYQPKEALRYCQQAVSVCEARLKRLKIEVATAKGLVDSKGKAPISDSSPEATHSLGELATVNSNATQGACCQKQEKEIKEIEELLTDLRDKVVELQTMASGPTLLESLRETNPAAVASVTQIFNVAATMAGQGGSSGSASHTEPSAGFDAPTNTASTAPVTHLGVVGRGVKRATPVPVSNGQAASIKKRTLDDMMTRDGEGETQIGFGTSTNSSEIVEHNA